MADSQRKNERVPFTGRVKVHTPTMQEGTGVDLAVGGVSIHVPHHLPEGSPVVVELFGDGNPVEGTVRRVTPHEAGGVRLGIHFHEENGHIVSRWQALAG
jgi:hypothetical protein